MPHEEVQSYLTGIPGSDRTRAAAWDAVYNVPDDAQAQQVIRALPYPTEVKAVLWEYRTKAATEQTTPQPEGSAVGRFASGMASQLNPITLVQGLYGAVRHPIDTATNILGAQVAQGKQAIDLASQPGILPKIQAVGHGAAAVLPLIGPQAAQAGEQIASGDVAGGLGKGAGMLAPFAAQKALEMRAASKAATTAPILERQAAQQVSQRVLAPGNVKFKGKAEAIAPEVLRRGMKGGREELAQAAEEGMHQSGQAIDDAIAAGGGPQSGVIVDPIIKQLQQRIDDLSVQGKPIPGAEGRVKGLQARIDYLTNVSRQRQGIVLAKQPVTSPRAVSFDELKRLRDEQYRIADEARAYQRMGNPALSDEGFAARETGSAIRGELAKLSPDFAEANADYAFFKTLGDVLDPAQGRPKVTAPSAGITGGAATSGAVAGALVSPKVAFVLSVVRPWIKKMRSEPAWQLADAQSKMRLAQAIRKGDLTTSRRLMLRISEGLVATNPNGSQTATGPATP